MMSGPNHRFSAATARRPIRSLSEDVANKIAAGEVIERPASVVKELVENALDAGASSIAVDVLGGGKELIRVTDNGCGLSPEDAALAFQRHATSKIESADDLHYVSTLGFRGEALPSVASVSKVVLTSRPADADLGVRLEVAGNAMQSTACGAPIGTQIEVKTLFYNTPARLKFLKSEATERRYIAEYVGNMALAHPAVAFRLSMEGREILRTAGDDHLKGCIGAVFGQGVLPDLLPVEGFSPFAAISGYIGKPSIAKGNRSAESVFVNGRWVQNRMLTAAIEKGYDSLLAHRRFPLAVLHLVIEPSLIDVNVHPAKTEIRFKEERETFKAVMLAVRKTLTQADLTGSFGPRPAPPPTSTSAATPVVSQPRIDFAYDEPVSRGKKAPAESVEEAQPTFAPKWTSPVAAPTRTADDDPPAHSRLPLAGGKAAEALLKMRAEIERTGSSPRHLLVESPALGQLDRTYLILATPLGLWLIDQHVAHERILYEKVLSEAKGERDPVVQSLLMPQRLELTPIQAQTLEERRDYIEKLGFVVESFGGNDYLLRGVPATIGDRGAARLERLLEDLVDALGQTGPSFHERVAASIACRSAIKAGERLQPEEMRALLCDLAQTENPFACPHGRPIIMQLSLDEIERRFGRS